MKTQLKVVLKIVSFILNIAWYINIILIVVSLTMLTWKFITSDFAEFSAPVKYKGNAEIISLDPVTSNADHITAQRDQATIRMELKNSTGYVLTAYFFLIGFEALAMLIIYHLRKFFNTIKKSSPFEQINIRRLKITALCFALLTPLHMLLGVSTYLILKENIKDFDLMQMVWSESFIGVILGAVIYIMADVFKYGFELKKENEGFI